MQENQENLDRAKLVRLVGPFFLQNGKIYKQLEVYISKWKEN
jgi:hypothetical protein